MVINVREKSIEEIEAKLNSITTDLNKIVYLESALKENFTFQIKRFILDKLVDLYEDRKMYEKAARAMSNRAGIDVTFRDKIESYLKAGELYAKAGKVEDAEEMFTRATRDANHEQFQRIKLAMKNIFLENAKFLEKSGRRVSAMKFYERLVKMNLDKDEKDLIKEKLLDIYKSMGKMREAKLLEGL